MNMLQTKKEELKKQGKKGFTLMELLIVVAIIAVLVAIAIPLFTQQLEKAREATDEANIRSAYAACSTAVLTEGTSDVKGDAFEVKYENGTATCTVTLTQQVDGWTDSKAPNIGGITLNGEPSKGGTAVVTISNTGSSIEFKAAAA